MPDKPISQDELIALSAIPATAYVPVVDPTEVDLADRNKRMLVKDITDEFARIDAKTVLPARVAFASPTYTGLSAPFFTTEDLAITYLSSLTPTQAAPCELISKCPPASQTSQNRFTLEAAYISIKRMNDSSYGSGLRRYAFSLTGAVATEFVNELGASPVWTHPSAGMYVGTLAGAFPVNKTNLPADIIGNKLSIVVGDGELTGYIGICVGAPHTISVQTFDADFIAADISFSNIFFEVLIKN